MQRSLSSGLLFVSFIALAYGCASKSSFQPTANPDQNGDQVADDLGNTVDANADGVADTIDMNADGVADGLGVDTNGDGVVDALAIDTDADGLYDALDTTGDGVPDVFSDLVNQPAGSGGSVAGGTGGAGTGGAQTGTGGGVVGTGGGVATPRTLPEGWSGFVTSKVTDAILESSYAAFKTNQVEDCGGGKIRIKRDATDGNDTVSEGIGYGMLLAVAHDDQPLFDGLFAYYDGFASGNGGVMPWKVSGCSGVVDSNSATDADLDVAMALIQASCKWGGDYKTKGASLMGAMASTLVGTKGGNATLKAGKNDFDQECLNASYVAPGYYRAFAVVDAAHAATWNSLAADSYDLLNGVANASTGLVPDWSGPCGDGKSANYTYDAARTPWRVATDYSWYGTPAAKTFADRMTNWVAGLPQSIGEIKDGYSLSGGALGTYASPVFIGAFADAALAHSQERADEFGQVLTVSRANNYFSRSLKALYVLLAAGKFEKSCY